MYQETDKARTGLVLAPIPPLAGVPNSFHTDEEPEGGGCGSFLILGA